MRFLSICSGIEAASVAWHQLGWHAAAFAEVDPFPSAVLAHHFPEVRNLGDFTRITAEDVGAIDLLVGGTPCQTFSVAGKRAGLDDPRGVLAFEFVRLAQRTRPRWVVFENVPGLLSSRGGADFGDWLTALAECGYGWAYRVLDAQHFGCPVARPRVFVVGYSGDWRPPTAVLFQRECLGGNSPSVDQGVPVRSGPVLTRLGAMAYDDRTPCVLEQWGARRATPLEWERALGFPDGWTAIPKSTLLRVRRAKAALRLSQTAARPDGPALVVQDLLQREGTCEPYQDIDAGTEASVELGDALQPDPRTGRSNAPRSGLGMPDLPRSIDTPAHRPQPLDGGGSRDPLPFVQHQASGDRGRGLRESGATVPEPIVADGPRYRAIGNSMAVPCMRWIGERIELCERALSAREVAA